MDRIVKLLENEAASAVFRLRVCAGTIAAAVISLVVALGWFVIRPATLTIRRQVDELEHQVADRTCALYTAFEKLQCEVADRQAAELKNQRLAAQLAHAARVTTLGHLAAGLAHELNQPLATIANYTEACDVELDRHQNGAWSDRLRTNLERTKKAALRAGQIVRRMRNFVRPDLSAATFIEIDTLIREVVEFCQTEIDQAAATIMMDLTDDDAAVCVDAIQIQQVIVNLIHNALHAVGERPVDERHIAIRASTSADFIRVDVVDSGPGFAAPDWETIFAPFYTTKRDGLGIGLSICRAIVEEHGGAIWAEAARNLGAMVSFTLPRVSNSESNVGTSRTPADCVCS
jgi:C4-dicarboxylate-specific signal transduction histidine kinase